MTWSLKKYGPATARVLFDHIVVQLGQHTIAYAQHSPERSNETNTQVRHLGPVHDSRRLDDVHCATFVSKASREHLGEARFVAVDRQLVAP